MEKFDQQGGANPETPLSDIFEADMVLPGGETAKQLSDLAEERKISAMHIELGKLKPLEQKVVNDVIGGLELKKGSKAEKMYKGALKKVKKGIISHLKGDMGHQGASAYDAYSMKSHLTAEAYASFMERRTAAAKDLYSKLDERWNITEKYVTPFRLGLTTWNLSQRQLTERLMKLTKWDKGHAFIRAGHIYAKTMAYFGKGSHALQIARSHQKKLANKVFKHNLTPQQFGRLTQVMAAPLFNLHIVNRIKRDYAAIMERIQEHEIDLKGKTEKELNEKAKEANKAHEKVVEEK